MRVYVDTNVLLDMIKDRTNLFGESLGDYASKLFAHSFFCKFEVVVSDWTLEELYKFISPEDTTSFFETLKKKIILVPYDEMDVLKAKERSENNFPDALHIIIAEKNNVDFIITSNTKDFFEIGSSVKIFKPKDFLKTEFFS